MDKFKFRIFWSDPCTVLWTYKYAILTSSHSPPATWSRIKGRYALSAISIKENKAMFTPPRENYTPKYSVKWNWTKSNQQEGNVSTFLWGFWKEWHSLLWVTFILLPLSFPFLNTTSLTEPLCTNAGTFQYSHSQITNYLTLLRIAVCRNRVWYKKKKSTVC